jgi:hypothetical protein
LANAPVGHRRRQIVCGLAAATAACTRGGDAPIIEDVARIDETPVAGTFRPTSAQSITARLAQTRGAVSIGGARYSMGG